MRDLLTGLMEQTVRLRLHVVGMVAGAIADVVDDYVIIDEASGDRTYIAIAHIVSVTLA